MGDDFWLGFFVGLAAAGIVGFVAQQIYLLYKQAIQAGQPQKVFLETKKTPNQVVTGSITAGCLLVLLILFTALLCWWALNSV